jgi:hypothetical protein
MTRIVGERIGAILGTSDNKVVKFLGYGIYEGEEMPPADIGGYNFGLPNPKLKLDSGEITWGCECWWGSEKGIREKLEIYRSQGYDIQMVSIVAERAIADAAQVIAVELKKAHG